MSDINTFWADLQAETEAAFRYTPMTDEQYQISCVNDISAWAAKVAGEWNGDEAGSQEDRARQADEIINKCQELKELISDMEEL